MQNNKEKFMLQIIDVSHGIMYDQQKAENTFLALINACVSHELRNPLNSIIAQNIEKQHLYSELSKLIDSYRDKENTGQMKELLDKITGIQDSLNEGLKIQQSSANIMTFIVQDLLDYA